MIWTTLIDGFLNLVLTKGAEKLLVEPTLQKLIKVIKGDNIKKFANYLTKAFKFRFNKYFRKICYTRKDKKNARKVITNLLKNGTIKASDMILESEMKTLIESGDTENKLLRNLVAIIFNSLNDEDIDFRIENSEVFRKIIYDILLDIYRDIFNTIMNNEVFSQIIQNYGAIYGLEITHKIEKEINELINKFENAIDTLSDIDVNVKTILADVKFIKKAFQKIPPEKKVKILFLSSNPIDRRIIQTDLEISKVKKALRGNQSFSLITELAFSIDDFGYVIQHNPDILHFGGWCSENYEIIVEDRKRKSFRIDFDAFYKWLSYFENLRCVIINTGYSELAARQASEHFDCAIGWGRALSDKIYVEFSESFYESISNGDSVKLAFDNACQYIKLMSPDVKLEKSDLPRLYSRIDPTKIVFK